MVKVAPFGFNNEPREEQNISSHNKCEGRMRERDREIERERWGGGGEYAKKGREKENSVCVLMTHR